MTAMLKPLVLGAGLLVLALLWLWGGGPPAAQAAGPICTVCPPGPGQTGGCDYTTIQAAVDDTGCMEIKVAQGVYTDVQARPAPADYPRRLRGALIIQVVYISRTVAVRGGYTTTNWTTPYPVTQPTTLDPSRPGRVLVILVIAGEVGAASAGAISPTIEGLALTNGCADRLGGGLGREDDGGGGVYVIGAAAVISANSVTSSSADSGGGLFLYFSPATLISNSVTANTAYLDGGGLFLSDSPATLTSNSVTANTAHGSGGGLILARSPAALTSNDVTANTAHGSGGGLSLGQSPAALSANRVTSNTANGSGGGLYLDESDATLSANSVTANIAVNQGGGLYLSFSDATLSANSVTSNTALYGGGLDIWASPATLISNPDTSNTARISYGPSQVGELPLARFFITAGLVLIVWEIVSKIEGAFFVRSKGNVKRGIGIGSAPPSFDQENFFRYLPDGVLNDSSGAFIKKADNAVLVQHFPAEQALTVGFERAIIPCVAYIDLNGGQPSIEYRIPIAPIPGLGMWTAVGVPWIGVVVWNAPLLFVPLLLIIPVYVVIYEWRKYRSLAAQKKRILALISEMMQAYSAERGPAESADSSIY